MQRISNNASWFVSLNTIPFRIFQMHFECGAIEGQLLKYEIDPSSFHILWQADNSKWWKERNVLQILHPVDSPRIPSTGEVPIYRYWESKADKSV